jgi:CRP-like cAMP-binding protein
VSKDLMKIYKAVQLFEGLNDEQLLALINISEPLSYQDGQIVFDQDDEGDQLYIIRQGQVEINLRKGDTNQQMTAVYLGQGQVIGEIALIDYGKRSASVRVAADNTILDTIHRDKFNQLCQSNTAIGYVVMTNLASDLAYKLRRQNMDVAQDS